MQRLRIAVCVAILTACWMAAGARPASAQMDTAILTGRVLAPSGAAVAGARVRIVSQATTGAKETTTNRSGRYSLLGLAPGAYQFTVLAGNFATLVNHSLVLTAGRREIYDVTLQTGTEQVTVTTQPEPLDTTSSANGMTILADQVDDLPINRRNFMEFSLLASAVKRDDTPLAGAIPTSGLDINGQRARGNELLVNGVDAVDPATGGFRTTVPLEAVQQFQVLENNYMPEYGRAIGGVIDVVTRSGSDDRHGDVFGYLRNSRIQARDPFSVQVNPATGAATPVKQPYTRVQAGFSLGGALQQDKTFYFLSAEAVRTEGTGFSSIGDGNFGLSQQTVPCLANPVLMTAAQASFFQNAIPSAGGCASQTGSLLTQAEGLYGAASATALSGNLANGPTSFPVPVDCSGSGCTSANVVPLPQSFQGLASAIGNYPTTEKTETGTIRLDRIWNSNQRTFVSFSITPSYQDGIEVNVPGQNIGLVSGSRASEQHFEDLMGEGQHTMTLSDNLLNVIRFEYGRRGFRYSFSPLPGGSNVAVNIPGAAFLGREPLSALTQIEKRFELADDLTWLRGGHTMKFGVDANFLEFTATKGQMYDLNYGGAYNFASIPASSVPSGVLAQLGPQALPDFTAVQAYGLGIPQSFAQGIGAADQPFDVRMIGAFLQDSWQLNSRLTVNYGIRYDLSLAPTFVPATLVNQFNVNQNAASALHVSYGIPNDYKNIAPRLGFAWDPTGSGKTAVRAGFGLFYGVTPMAVIYDASATDGALSTQLGVPAGTATGIPVSQSTLLEALNASSLFQGVFGGIPTIPSSGAAACGLSFPSNFGYLCGQQRFNSTLLGSVFTNQNYLSGGYTLPILPFTLPVANNFVSMYSEQGGLTLEHTFASGFDVSASYTFIRGVHLNRSRNINQASAVLLTQNFANAEAVGLTASSPLAVEVPLASPDSCISTSAATSYQVIAPGELADGFASSNCTGTPFAYIGTPAVFNDFRPSGPNPSYGGANLQGYPQLVALAKMAGFPAGYGTPVAWGDVQQQESTGGSLYNGFTLTVSKRFSDRYQLLSSWTWSHARDNTTGLSYLEDPQNNDNPNLEWGNSAFDQRQRWVTSAILRSPYTGKQKGFVKRLLENSFAAPIFDFGSGRPYTVLTGTDYNLNFNSSTDRPSVVAPGAAGSASSPYIPGVAFALPTVCAAGIPASVQPYGCDGNLGRNTFVTPRYISFDLRLDKQLYLSESKSFEIIAEGFNLLNRFNVLDVNQICNPAAGSTCMAGQPTAAFNPRQFQIALKFNF